MRHAAIAAVIVALLAPPAAFAQTTDCTQTLTGFSCSTDRNSMEGFAALGNAIRARKEQKQAKEAFAAAISEGRCDDARDLAARYGKPSDITAVGQYCKSPSELQKVADAEAAQREAAWMGGIAKAVKEGRCDEAKVMALGASRLDIADQVVRVCTPTH